MRHEAPHAWHEAEDTSDSFTLMSGDWQIGHRGTGHLRFDARLAPGLRVAATAGWGRGDAPTP